jgi:HD-like signal output (HDOD) protein
MELEARGSTHAELGAHLLDLWGIPHTVVEAVAYHHAPRAAHGALFDHVTAVHVADALADEYLIAHEDREQLAPAPLDEEYLAELGVADEIERFRAIAREEALRLEPL